MLKALALALLLTLMPQVAFAADPLEENNPDSGISVTGASLDSASFTYQVWEAPSKTEDGPDEYRTAKTLTAPEGSYFCGWKFEHRRPVEPFINSSIDADPQPGNVTLRATVGKYVEVGLSPGSYIFYTGKMYTNIRVRFASSAGLEWAEAKALCNSDGYSTRRAVTTADNNGNLTYRYGD